MGEFFEIIEGSLVVRAGGIEKFPEHSAKVGEGIEDFDDDDLLVLSPVSEGHRHKFTVREYDPDGDERFIDEREEYEC